MTVVTVVTVFFLILCMSVLRFRYDRHAVLDRVDDLLHLVADICFIGVDLQLQSGKGESHIAVFLFELCFDFRRTVRTVQPFQYKFVFHIQSPYVGEGLDPPV